MAESGFHFAAPWWLILLAVPPLVWLWLRITAVRDDPGRYRDYADAHLLPLLLGSHQRQGRSGWRRLLPWVVAWSLLVTALATPRWGYEERQLFRAGIDLVVLLDLSASMDADDVAPSRLARARQEIEDLVNQNSRARVGLIAFASLAHVISPLTEDGATLLVQLPALTTDLVQLKGSRLSQALERADQMLAGSPERSSRHVLLVGDGDVGDDIALDMVRAMAANGIHFHALGVGTPEGAPVVTREGRALHYRNGDAVITRLAEARLKELAAAGNGLYRTAGFRNSDTADILDAVARDARAETVEGQVTKVWNERFYWPAAMALLVLLPQFRGPGRSSRGRPVP